MAKPKTSPRITEAQLQDQIVEGLRALGYEVLVTTARRVRQGYGADHGVPDLLVAHKAWPVAIWLGLEVKREGRVRWSHEEQKRLWQENKTAVVRSLEDAAAAIVFTERYGFDTDHPIVPATWPLAESVGKDRLHSEVFARAE